MSASNEADTTESSSTSSLAICSGPLQAHAVRLTPHTDLVPALLHAAQQAMTQSNSSSAFVMTAVGSLERVTLRMAATDNDKSENEKEKKQRIQVEESTAHTSTNKKRKTNTDISSSLAEATSLQIQTFDQHFEIVSLVGTFSRDSQKHLHMSVSDANGKVLGGHLVDAQVFTTCELVLGTIGGVQFSRAMDTETGYKELNVAHHKDPL